MVIYTKKGDRGRTSVCNKESGKLSKASARMKAVGTVDELNCFVGLVVSFVDEGEISEQLMEVQRNLFVIGSKIAGAEIDLDAKASGKLEKRIDMMDTDLPPLRNFILPGGSTAGAFVHAGRSVARRAEREVVDYVKGSGGEREFADALRYMNRLSDYFFVLARWVNKKSGVEERVWKGEG